MSKCVNEKCNKNPMNSLYNVVANVDGDFACSPECLKNYKEQRDNFFNNISDDNFYKKWWRE